MSRIMDVPLNIMRSVLHNLKVKLPAEAMQKLYTELGMGKEILLLYATAWKNDDLDDTKGLLPFPKKLLMENGQYAESSYWFRKNWLLKNFKDRILRGVN